MGILASGLKDTGSLPPRSRLAGERGQLPFISSLTHAHSPRTVSFGLSPSRLEWWRGFPCCSLVKTPVTSQQERGRLQDIYTHRQVSLGSFSTFPAERNEKMQFRKSPSLRGCEAEDPRKTVRVLSCTFWVLSATGNNSGNSTEMACWNFVAQLSFVCLSTAFVFGAWPFGFISRCYSTYSTLSWLTCAHFI